ncbi:MAG TPA: hemerythrin domain-containing protein [Actinomycetota bacterium]|jgi:hemerythrin-like domain-containing protein|nr:hemerythrin domain-containing protein [Actinomycetota bacterium]
MNKRLDALLPLTRDHHHALSQARRLKTASGSEDRATRIRAADDFVNFYLGRALHHFREEEELFFPPAIEHDQARPLVERAVLEHLNIHRLVGLLKRDLVKAAVTPELMAEIAETLRLHVRFEEDELFPLIEKLVPLDRLEEVAGHRREV